MHMTRARWLYLIVSVAGVAALVLAVVFGLGVFRYLRAGDYPGAMQMADHFVYRFTPNPTVRRESSYRTTDPFPKVYNWYSSGFALGPEQHAQSACILMANGQTQLLFIRTTMSVTLCETATGRMMFVMRSVTLDWR